ncbi:MAG: hypothetical protein ACLFTT_08705 [Candidatus Hydrogenedentota bacterium]
MSWQLGCPSSVRKNEAQPARLRDPGGENMLTTLRTHTHTGRPLGSEHFVTAIEGQLGRILHRKYPGCPKKDTGRR